MYYRNEGSVVTSKRKRDVVQGWGVRGVRGRLCLGVCPVEFLASLRVPAFPISVPAKPLVRGDEEGGRVP